MRTFYDDTLQYFRLSVSKISRGQIDNLQEQTYGVYAAFALFLDSQYRLS